MGMMSTSHPYVLRFIRAKNKPTAFTNFNLSVKVPDAFMQQLKDNPDVPHAVTNPHTRKRYVMPHSVNVYSYTIDYLLLEDHAADDCYNVKEVWNMIIEDAWATGDPGIVFIDYINRDNPTPAPRPDRSLQSMWRTAPSGVLILQSGQY